MRAAQMYSSILECKQKKHIILMGHSYGGATVIQTYHSLDS
jgi:predicted alpha/beta superfamily hydrolase